jgi:hypothetical protein
VAIHRWKNGGEGSAHEGIFIAITERAVHLFLLHHMVREVKDSEVEPVISPLIKYHLTCLVRDHFQWENEVDG